MNNFKAREAAEGCGLFNARESCGGHRSTGYQCSYISNQEDGPEYSTCIMIRNFHLKNWFFTPFGFINLYLRKHRDQGLFASKIKLKISVIIFSHSK